MPSSVLLPAGGYENLDITYENTEAMEMVGKSNTLADEFVSFHTYFYMVKSQQFVQDGAAVHRHTEKMSPYMITVFR
jgi:hypothetical protein